MVKRHTADFLPITGEYLIPQRKLIDYPTIKFQIENCAEGLRVDVEAFIAAMPARRIEIDKKWPRDWWQAFRERWFPQWWLIRHPVRHDRIYVNQQLYSQVCPHLQKTTRDLHLEFLSFGISPGGVIDGECSD